MVTAAFGVWQRARGWPCVLWVHRPLPLLSGQSSIGPGQAWPHALCVGAQLTTPFSIQGPLETNRDQIPKPCKNAAEICGLFPLGSQFRLVAENC